MVQSSETSAYKIQALGNYPEENIQHKVQGESLKSIFLHEDGTECFETSAYKIQPPRNYPEENTT
jgi:hypothetical protein